MDSNTTTLERAFQLAQSGDCASIKDIRSRLKVESYDVSPLQGPTLFAQLRKLIRARQQSEADGSGEPPYSTKGVSAVG
jgi:hypothetical protein